MKTISVLNLKKIIFIGVLILALIASSGCTSEESSLMKTWKVQPPVEAAGAITGTDNSTESAEITITDGCGRELTIPTNVESTICSGAGCLRYLVYLQAQDLIVRVDSIELEESELEGRPYALANPQRVETGRLTAFDAVLLGQRPHIKWDVREKKP